jgi:hypothetical protein
MMRAIVLIVAIVLFRAVLPRHSRRSITGVTPYGSVFDAAVPAELVCSPLCDPLAMQARDRRAPRRDLRQGLQLLRH